MIFIDPRRHEYWRRVTRVVGQWANDGIRVVDVACGFGKWAHLFPPGQYVGLDFSEEMIAIARRENPAHTFQLLDAKGDIAVPVADVIYEINSLKSLGMTHDDFVKRFSPYAKVAVATLEADEFRVVQLY